MKTRCNVLFIGAFVAGFVLLPVPVFGQGSGEPVRDRTGLLMNPENSGDTIYLYVTENMGPAGKLLVKELERPETRQLLSGDFNIRQIELPTRFKLGDRIQVRHAAQGLKHGVRAVPAMVFCDAEGRAYGRLYGGLKSSRDVPDKVRQILATASLKEHRDKLLDDLGTAPGPEKERLILEALDSVPVESWFDDYPNQMAELALAGCNDPRYVAACMANVRNAYQDQVLAIMSTVSGEPGLAEIDSTLEKVEQLARTEGLEPIRRQHLLLTLAYPLCVRKSALLYNGTTSGELEEAFNKSIAILEEVRDIDRESVWGRRAHAVREELRKARLAAAKYD